MCSMCHDIKKECKVCKKQLVKLQKSTCSWGCRAIYVNNLNIGRPSWNKGKKGWAKGTEAGFQNGHKGFLVGESRNQSNQNHKGLKHWRWKGGITSLLLQIRHSFRYRQWVLDVFTRDNWTCQKCFVMGGKLEAHHIKEFSKIIHENKIITLNSTQECSELWNINNGMTLCKKCHRKTKHDVNYTQNKYR